ncbi:hypothetical protein [Aquabacterium sp.]|uniref:hypothetical protein n=1 Tax=Aquabacterium sp. TaxID=1872578 RepID=UPI0037849B83
MDTGAASARRRLLQAAAALLLPPARAAEEADQPVIDRLDVAGSQIELQFAPGFDQPLRGRARQWVERSAQAVVAYFGRFPQPQVELLLLPTPGAGVRGGTTFGEPSPYVRLRLGVDTGEPQFHDDWVLVHEMVHLAIPRVPRRHGWLQEGLATYVEGIARARAGLLPAPQLWGALAHDMPQGQPKDGDEGLDHTPTWGRTYWGGAIFCLLADVQVRRRSGGALGLEHALRGVLAAGGSYAVAWPIERTLAVADAAVGQTTFGELYALLKDCPAPVDLPALWQDLGVTLQADGLARLQADAPLARLREAIAA